MGVLLPLSSLLCTSPEDGFVRLKDIMELKNFRPYNLEAIATGAMTYLSAAAPRMPKELMACVYFDEKERYTMAGA